MLLGKLAIEDPTMPRLTLSTVALALVLAVPTGAAGKIAKSDRFQLWNGCQPVALAVAFKEPKRSKIDLTKEVIEATVRSRLRTARIYGGKDTAVTAFFVEVIQVIESPPLFRVKFEHIKVLMDEMSEVRDFSRTWFEYRWTGAKDTATVPSVLAQSSDKFIDEYLRVNADACK